MGPRLRLTGLGGVGPVWVWVDHITSVWTVSGKTAITVVGGRDPIGVMETPGQVLAWIDAAAGGVVDAEGNLTVMTEDEIRELAALLKHTHDTAAGDPWKAMAVLKIGGCT